VFGGGSGVGLGLGPVLGGALVDGFGWRAIFWVNVPIIAIAVVCTALFVPESRAARARRADPVGLTLVFLVLGSLIYAIIESGRRGWTSPLVLALLAVAVVALLAILRYEPHRVDPLLELRLFRSAPFSSAILIALLSLCGFGAFLFVTTLYLQDVRGLSPLKAGLCLLPVGVLIALLSPLAGRLVGARGPRLPLVVSGVALALAGLASVGLGPNTSLLALLGTCLLFGIAQGTVNPPISNSAVSGMPASMASLAASLASAGRQTGISLGIAISGTMLGSAAARGGTAFTTAEHRVWWLVAALGVGITVLGILSTGRRAHNTAARAATLFAQLDDSGLQDRGESIVPHVQQDAGQQRVGAVAHISENQAEQDDR
jgi:predicted MFS family arabinose efflux permease